jgi:hypothetical protein
MPMEDLLHDFIISITFLRALRVLVWLNKKIFKRKRGGAGGVPPHPKKVISFMLSLIGKTIITLEEREGSCRGPRARHEVSSFPPGKNRGLTWCIDTV